MEAGHPKKLIFNHRIMPSFTNDKDSLHWNHFSLFKHFNPHRVWHFKNMTKYFERSTEKIGKLDQAYSVLLQVRERSHDWAVQCIRVWMSTCRCQPSWKSALPINSYSDTRARFAGSHLDNNWVRILPTDHSSLVFTIDIFLFSVRYDSVKNNYGHQLQK